MGILRKALSTARSDGAITVVPEGARLMGDLMLSGKLHLDGSFEGYLDCEGMLVIGKRGSIKGRVRAEELMVSGRVDAEIQCDRLHILAGGTVKGRVECQQFVLEERGDFIGERIGVTHGEKVIQEARQMLDSPLPVSQGPVVDLDNLLDSLPTQIKLGR